MEKNILFVFDNEFPWHYRIYREAIVLKDLGYKITIVSVNLNNKKSEETIDEIRIIRFKYNKKIYKKIHALSYTFPFLYWFWYKNLKNLLKKEKFDFIFAHDLPIAEVAFDISKKFNIPYILDLHENRPEIMKYYEWTKTSFGKILINLKKWERIQEKYSKLSDKLILVTKEAKKYYTEKYKLNSEKIFVIPNFPFWDEIKKVEIDIEIEKRLKNKFTIIYYGDTGLRRGTLDIIEVAKRLENDVSIHFIIAGFSKEQEILENKVKVLELKNVEFTGYISETRAYQFMKSCNAGISPLKRNIHHDTTYAIKIFQYLACELPIIVSDCPSQANVVFENNVGCVFEDGNIDEMIQCIYKLKDNPTKIDFNLLKLKYDNNLVGEEFEKVFV